MSRSTILSRFAGPAASLLAVTALGQTSEPSSMAPANWILGTQAIGGKYQFTAQHPLLEAATVVQDMGASCFKFALQLPPQPSPIQSVTSLVRDEPNYRRVLEMPFRDYFMWVNAAQEGAWTKGLTPELTLREYRQMYELTVHLLKTYQGTGKTFYLGHWEGDNMLRPGGIGPRGDEDMRDETRVQGFIDWLKIRQQAVDDAKRDTPHAQVAVWHYTEVNHPTISVLEDRPSLANRVLPHVAVDFISYSAYDSQHQPQLLIQTLDYLQARLHAKNGLPNKRVFLGEYGFWTRKEGVIKNTAEAQNTRSLAVVEAALEWGCPFILYWELYNNELDADGSHRGFWMIDDQGVKQPIYHSHRSFYEWARQWHQEFLHSHSGTMPTADEFRAAALAFIRQRLKGSGPLSQQNR